MPVSQQFAGEMMRTLVRLGISQREAAKRTRISPGYISNMCLGQVPSLGKLLQFTAALGIEPASLLEAANYPRVTLSEQGQTAAVLPSSEHSDSDVPLFGEVPAGDWRLAVGEHVERYPVPTAYTAVTDFCLRVIGDSMWPHLQPGDIVGVKAQSTAENGQVVVARLGDEVTVKCLRYERGRWVLTPFNPLYQAIPVAFDTPDFAILGVVAWHTHDWLLSDDRAARQRLVAQRGRRG